MRTSTRRLGAVVVTTALALGGALAPSPAQAANSYATDASGWLSRQLTHGVTHNDQFGDDYGLSLDVYFALKTLKERPAAAASVLNALDDHVSDYISFDNETFAGSVAKLATAVETQKRDPRRFGGVNLIQRLVQRVHKTADAQQGRASDGPGDDFSNTIGQSFAVRALTGVDNPWADEATTFLLKQQCAAGFFRENLASTDGSFSCAGGSASESAPSVDSTGFAVQALVAARSHGTTGLGGRLKRASDWLVSQQRPNGSFVGNGTANTNSTGLAATALSLTGRSAAAERAAVWISRRQVTSSVAAARPKLSREVGAIAYDDKAFADGKQAGIPTDQRDQWRRATAQAAMGVAAVRSLRVAVPSGYLHGGSSIPVRVTGLAANEPFSVRLGARGVPGGTATVGGTARRSLALPRVTRRLAVAVLGTSSRRTGHATVAVLGPRTFSTKLRNRPVHRGRLERITVTGLAPREPATIGYRGERIWKGRASTSGKIVHSFRAGRSLGRKKLVVHGRFADRSATTHLRVVR